MNEHLLKKIAVVSSFNLKLLHHTHTDTLGHTWMHVYKNVQYAFTVCGQLIIMNGFKWSCSVWQCCIFEAEKKSAPNMSENEIDMERKRVRESIWTHRCRVQLLMFHATHSFCNRIMLSLYIYRYIVRAMHILFQTECWYIWKFGVRVWVLSISISAKQRD